jgi:outer membrane receptor protein involved in Fe transport
MFVLRACFRQIVLAIIAALVTVGVGWAGNTGKISGRVVDERTADPIPYASVQIQGTTMGAQTDDQGFYAILNVAPGTYTVRTSNVGYAELIQKEVEIRADQTTSLDFKLTASDIQGDTVIVIAPPEAINFNTVGTQRTVSAAQIATLPVTTVDEVLSLQVGFVKQGDQLHVRGGRAGEILTIVDGVQVRDPLGGRGGFDGEGGSDAALNVATQSIQEVNIIKGGFDAEYGNAQSAIVNITTREGSLSGTEGEVRYITDNFHLNSLNKYSFNYDRLQIAFGGPDPVLTKHILPAMGVDELSGKLAYYVSATGTQQDGYRNYNSALPNGVQPDLFKSRDFLGITLNDRFTNSYNLEGKVTYKATPNIRVNLNYQGSWDYYTGYNWNYLYTPNTAPNAQEASGLYSLKWAHNVSKSTFYQVQISQFSKSYLERPGDPNNPGDGLNPDQFLFNDQFESYVDNNHNGVWDSDESFENIYEDYNPNGTPKYTFGDQFADNNGNGVYEPATDSILFDWNGNGRVDFNQGEPFNDNNHNGSWDAAESYIDRNGNYRYDAELRDLFAEDRPEPYTDGDANIGEPFVDVNENGVFDAGIDRFVISTDPTVNQDLNFNSVYDGPEQFPTFIPGTYVDLNRNGRYDFANGIYDDGEPFVDVDGNAVYTPSDQFFDYGTYQDQAWYEERHITLKTAQFDITSQLRREHTVKTGALVELNTLEKATLENPWARYDGIPDGGPYKDRGLRRDFYKREPIRAALYIQDLMEYGQMIARLGVRWDFFLQSDDVKYDPLIQGVQSDIAEQQSKVSPRIGFSYPITDKAKIYFNYGHFYQLPEFQYMYRRASQATSTGGTVGNVNLSYTKQINYEFGVDYLISDQYSLKVAGFYKDYFDLIATTIGESGPLAREQFVNSDYARSRGFEFELAKAYGGYVSGFFNYQYAFAFGKSSAENENYELLFQSRFIPIDEFPLEWDVRHQFTLNVDLRVGNKQYPRLFGLKLPDNWGANLTWQFSSGFPYTPDRTNPEAEILPGQREPEKHSLRRPAISTVDVRSWKNFTLYGMRYSFELWVQNLLDTKNVDAVYAATGRAYTSQNTNGIVFDGTDHDTNPTNYLPGRNVRMGLSLRF